MQLLQIKHEAAHINDAKMFRCRRMVHCCMPRDVILFSAVVVDTVTIAISVGLSAPALLLFTVLFSTVLLKNNFAHYIKPKELVSSGHVLDLSAGLMASHSSVVHMRWIIFEHWSSCHSI